MKEFLEFIVKHLVDYPERVALKEEEKEDRVVFTVNVAEGDVGKVIAKKGRTAQVLRALLSAVAAKGGKRAILEIAD
jgi:uncharacterized protein